jgi:hypothetical protein
MYGNGELTCSRLYCSNDEDKLVATLMKNEMRRNDICEDLKTQAVEIYISFIF